MLDDGAPDHTEEAYLMTQARLASELRDLAKRTRAVGPDALRRAVLLEAASRIEIPYAWHSARQRDDYRRRGLDAFGNEIIHEEDDGPCETD